MTHNKFVVIVTKVLNVPSELEEKSQLLFIQSEFRTILKLLDIQFDILAISESKLQKNIQPHTDIFIDGYQNPISTCSEKNIEKLN